MSLTILAQRTTPTADAGADELLTVAPAGWTADATVGTRVACAGVHLCKQEQRDSFFHATVKWSAQGYIWLEISI